MQRFIFVFLFGTLLLWACSRSVPTKAQTSLVQPPAPVLTTTAPRRFSVHRVSVHGEVKNPFELFILKDEVDGRCFVYDGFWDESPGSIGPQVPCE